MPHIICKLHRKYEINVYIDGNQFHCKMLTDLITKQKMMAKQITQTMRFLNIKNHDIHKKATMDKGGRKSNIYCNATSNTKTSYNNCNILKEDQFYGFCLDTGATRTTKYDLNIQPKRTVSSFGFCATNYQSLESFTSIIPLPNGKTLHIKTNILQINVPFPIGLDIFMEHCMTMNFEKRLLVCKK